MSDSEFDFRIRVIDSDGCSDGATDCFGLTNFETNYNAGLRCKVYVGASDCGTSASKPIVDHLQENACMKWDNFYDASKLGNTKKYLTVTDAQGNLAIGTYSIVYNCNWVLQNGNDVPSSQTDWQELHTFMVREGVRTS